MSPANINRTIALQQSKHKDVMFAYASPFEGQECLQKFGEDDNKMKNFPIYDLSGNISHYIRFNSNVKNVINNTWHTKDGKMEKECVYFLLENGDLHRFSWEKLAKPEKGMFLTDETRQVIASNGDGRKITLVDLHDSKLCLVYNRRVLEVILNEQARTENIKQVRSEDLESHPNTPSKTSSEEGELEFEPNDEEELELKSNKSFEIESTVQVEQSEFLLGPNN